MHAHVRTCQQHHIAQRGTHAAHRWILALFLAALLRLVVSIALALLGLALLGTLLLLVALLAGLLGLLAGLGGRLCCHQGLEVGQQHAHLLIHLRGDGAKRRQRTATQQQMQM